MSADTAAKGSRFYLPQLDGLRFLAFLLVFFSHFQWAPHDIERLPVIGWSLIGLHRQGGIGVDLFLVLSAYLITTLLLLEQRKRGRISLKFFYIRRTLRIWPLYFFYLALLMFILPLVLWHTFSSPEHQAVLSTHGAASAVFLANFSESFTDIEVPKRIGHLWTISMEEQFYVMWPALLVLMLRHRKVMVTFLFGAIAFSMGLRAASVVYGLDIVILKNTLTRLDPLAIGSLLALLRLDRPSEERRAAVRLFAGLLLLWLVSLAPRPRTESLHVVWQYTAIAAGFAAIIDAGIGSAHNWIGRFLSLRPLVWLGQISYGLYVYHFLGIDLGAWVGGLLGASVESRLGWIVHCVASLSATILLSWISYRLLEAPFMKLKKRFALIASRDT